MRVPEPEPTLRLVFYTLRPGEHSERDLYEDEAFGTAGSPGSERAWTTLIEAKKAAVDVLMRAAAKQAEEITRRNAYEWPDAASRTWALESKTACYVEQRVVETRIEWMEVSNSCYPWKALIHTTCEYRYRWREVRQVTSLAEDGTGKIVHELAPPGEWSAWCKGGIYHRGGIDPRDLSVNIQMNIVDFADGAKACRRWIADGVVQTTRRAADAARAAEEAAAEADRKNRRHR